MLTVYIDLGTTNLKAEIYNDKCKRIKSFKGVNTDIYFDSQNFIQCDNIISFLNNFIKEMIYQFDEEIKIVFSSAMHTAIILDKNNIPISSGFTLLDKISNSNLSIPFNKKSINGIVAGWFLPLYKINDFIKNERFQEINITTLKSYIVLEFCNQNVIEITDAVGLGLVDVKNSIYSKEILDTIGLNELQLPKIESSFKMIESNRFSKKVYFCLGLSDGVAAAYNEYLMNDNSLSLSIGTTIGIRKIVDNFIEPKDQLDYCFCLEDGKYIYGISSSNGGNNINLALKHAKLSFEDLNRKDFSKIESYKNEINFYKERNGENQVSKIDEFLLDDKLFFSLLEQLVERVFKFKIKIDTILKRETYISATGGAFNNPSILKLFQEKFKEKFKFANEDENLSIAGLIKLVNL